MSGAQDARRELAIAFQTDKSPDEYAKLARLSEQGGFDVVSVYNDLFFQPAIYPLLVMAQATERVRLGPAALNPYTLHPVEIAGQIAALDAVSGGRAYLGLVRGTWLETIGIEPRRPLTALREAVGVIRRLLAGDTSGFRGEQFSLARGQALRYEPLRREVPLLIGTWSEKTAAFAGEVAHEVKVGGSANPDLVAVMRERIGNDAVGIVMGAVTVVDEDGAAARGKARAELALYLPVVAPLDPTIDVDPALLRDAELIPEDVLSRFAFAGTPEDVVGQVETLFAAGASRVEFGTPHGREEEHGVRLLAERVVPYFRP